MKRLIFACLIIVTATACNKIECTEYSSDILYNDVDQGALYGNGDEGIGEENFVITTETEWNDLKAKMNSVNDVSNGFQNTPIDFDQQFVIACFDQVQSNGGYTLDVSNVEFNGSELEATIIKSGGSGMTTSVITRPYHIIVMDKCDKNPEVKFK